MADCVLIVEGKKARPPLRYQAPRFSVVPRSVFKPPSRDMILVASPQPIPADMVVSMASIIKVASTLSGFTVNEIKSARRFHRLCKVRQAVMYVARRHTSLSFPAIGQRLGGKDHTTVLHGIRCVEKNYHEFSGFIKELERHFPPLENCKNHSDVRRNAGGEGWGGLPA